MTTTTTGMFQALWRWKGRCGEVARVGTLTVAAGAFLSLKSCAGVSMVKMYLDLLANLSVNSLTSFY